MTSRWRVVATVVVFGCTPAFGCADFARGPGATAPDAGAEVGGQAGDGGALSFATSIHPLLAAACRSCHATGQQAGDTQLLLTADAAADYPSVSGFVDTAAPAGSRLLSKMGGSGHGGGTIYAAGAPEYQTVLQWIQQGAPP